MYHVPILYRWRGYEEGTYFDSPNAIMYLIQQCTAKGVHCYINRLLSNIRNGE